MSNEATVSPATAPELVPVTFEFPKVFFPAIKGVESYPVNTLDLAKSFAEIFEYGFQRKFNDAANKCGNDEKHGRTEAEGNALRKLNADAMHETLKNGAPAKRTRTVSGESALQREVRRLATEAVMKKAKPLGLKTSDDAVKVLIASTMLLPDIIADAERNLAKQANVSESIDMSALLAAAAAAKAAPVPAPAPVAASEPSPAPVAAPATSKGGKVARKAA